ncbi:cell division control protein (Cdc15), putative [Talaromyces stipitatus ATCC 10500]|uniref:Cell division control protein (Cdc15), putative n=1 Tax=Talaromyces stipitatus (strain ATCC 10500 / CBS 375.48 / QM 6759 / NRRL 1006) TaxID=441959 RepID=B8M7I7_TALSN|nr:cell division control protein (Cdc15), putative [Talaromyces stipitatus ATCC 10500]EED19540.1 cell division control protein (Cdc15), putative [Talaromyces stipitatus ATCC 10500]
MPGTTVDGPTVAMSFANNFWGKDDAGVIPLLERMHNAKVTCDEIKSFYNTRAAIEDEYARKLLALCRKPLGSNETGTLRLSLDVVRGETEAIAKAHAAISQQMKTELEEPLAAFAGGMKERRKIVQNTVEKLLKVKNQQTHSVNKARDRYEQDCLRIKGYLAQGHMVMGQEERKNKAKLEKTQIQLASNSNEYEAAVKVLQETTGRWNKEWKAACDKFQDLEEERLDFTKSSLWAYANIASTVCVSDDASCEKIRVSLEDCEVEKDIGSFIKERGTGQEIPDAPRFINFARGDINDTSSEASDEDNYSVAQFQRAINPAFRSSSPQPSTYESHHDPSSELAAQMGLPSATRTESREPAMTPQSPNPQPLPPSQPAQPVQPLQPAEPVQPSPLDLRRGVQLPPNYDPNQHGEIGNVPHNSYPTDGMTMFCRTGPPSERSSGTSAYRPSSREDSQSDISNPTSFSSQEPPSGKQSPVKPTNGVAMPGMTPEKQVQKKRSAFFSNSPFRRKSRHDKDRPSQSYSRSPTKPVYKQPSPEPPRSTSPEPVDPRASFQLNIGNNVFDVASPDKKPSPASQPPEDDLDPIARALAELKGVGKPSAGRVSADRYHGLATPAPSATSSTYESAGSADALPPSYNDPPAKRLDAPQPAFTSAQMQKTTQKYVGQTQSMFRASNSSQRTAASVQAPVQDIPRARSPAPPLAGSQNPQRTTARAHVPVQDITRARSPAPTLRRSASPQPAPAPAPVDARVSQYNAGSGSQGGSASRAPTTYQSRTYNFRSTQSPTTNTRPGSDRGYSPQQYSRHASPVEAARPVSPRPAFAQETRPASANGMELQLSGGHVESYRGGYDSYSGRGRDNTGRPQSMYYGNSSDSVSRSRSKSITVADPGRHISRDGRPILHFARALYSYNAAIPEELGFSKGDILAVLRLQDDGWWEAEVTGSRGHPGLVPSNYLQSI